MRCWNSSRILSLALFVGLLLPSTARSQLTGGQAFFGARVGLSGVGSTASVGVNGEVAYNEEITLGGFVDTWSYGESLSSTIGVTSWDVRYIALGGTGAYHFRIQSNPKLDPFLGLGLGYYVVSSETTAQGVTFSGDSSRIFLGGFGGLRYWFGDSVSAVGRLGFGSSFLSVGVDLGM